MSGGSKCSRELALSSRRARPPAPGTANVYCNGKLSNWSSKRCALASSCTMSLTRSKHGGTNSAPFYPRWDHVLETSMRRDMQLPATRKIRDLSHGMRMKMALVCALPFHPRLLILDEPFAGLDPIVRDELIAGLVQQAGELTILISSHELNEIEGLATDIGFLHAGRLLFQEPMSQLTERCREVYVTLDWTARVPDPLPAHWPRARAV